MAHLIRFETTECSRCGGTGEYSYNSLTGTRCFKCNGGKAQLTRKGAAARAAYDEAMDAMCRRQMWTVRAGDVVKPYGARQRWTTVVAADTRVVEMPSHGIVRFDSHLTFKNGTGYGGQAQTPIMVHPGAEAVQSIQADIAARFSGATLIEKAEAV
jgi:hypothetical protein